MRRLSWLGSSLLILIALAPRGFAAQNAPADPKRWEKNIAAFEAQDRTQPPPRDGILFVGSSSIVRWDVKQRFPGLPVINRGFGGSYIADSVFYADRIILPYRPAVIVFYAGENDIAGGKTPQQVAADFRQLVTIIRKDLPRVPILFIGLKPSPSRWKLIDSFRKTNQLIRDDIARGENLHFLDVEPRMLNADGQPNAELFVGDRLHLSAKGYDLWTSLLKPRLDALLKPEPALR